MENKKIFLAILVVIGLIALMATYSLSSTGMISKAFTKSVLPGDNIVQNITVRKFYNMTVRFRTALNGSDLSFDDIDASITTKDFNGSQIHLLTGISGGKVYNLTDKADIDRMSSVSVIGLDKYDDVIDQPVSFSFIGTKAYLTVLVVKRSGNATLAGFVFDELTDQPVGNIGILAFDSGSDANSTLPVSETVTNSSGIYNFSLVSDADGRSYDFYVTTYQVS